MRALRVALARLGGFLGKARRDQELANELESHLQMHIDDNVRAGMAPQEARRRALIALGGVESIKEAYRDRRGIPLIETCVQDVRFGIRLLLRQPGFAIVAILTLGLGIGATTAMFSIVDAVMLRPFPFPETDKLVMVWETNRDRGIHTFTGSAANYADWSQSTTAFADLGAWELRNENRTDGAEPEQVSGAVASSAFFRALRIDPALGRFFVAEEDQPAHRHVAVIGHEYWTRAFGSDADVVGRSVVINGEAHTVVGVLPPLRPPFRADIWRPLAPEVAGLDRGHHSLLVVGRLAAGQSMAGAEAELQTVAARLSAAFPESNRGWSVRAESLFDALVVDTTQRAMVILFIAVGLLLLIACVNVANLILARATGRFREMSTRLALGAPRSRLVRQLFTESALLAGAGALAGLFMAAWGLRLIQWLYPADLPGLAEAQLDPYALAFAVLLSIATTIVVGLVPAIQVSRRSFGGGLKQVTRAVSDTPRTRRLRHTFVVAEIALALVLLVGAGLLLRSVDRLRKVPLGFSPAQVLTAKVGLNGNKYESMSQYTTFVDRVLGEIESRPGIAAAGVSSSVPFGSGYTVMQIRSEADRGKSAAHVRQAGWRVVGGNYFSAVGIPVQSGRMFNGADDGRVPRVTIISQTLAHQIWPAQDPLGRFLLVGDRQRPYRVVGVVGDARLTTLDGDPEPAMYFHYRQFSWASMTIAVRAAGDTAALGSTIRTAVSAVDAEQPVFDVQPMSDLVERATATPQMNAALLTLFAVLAVLLSAIGVYGVMSYSAAQRTGEMGVRLALGAEPREVFSLVWRHGLALTAIGLGAGVAVALVAARAVGALLYEVSAWDPFTYAVGSGTMVIVALAACFAPAYRAMHTDPVVALRHE